MLSRKPEYRETPWSTASAEVIDGKDAIVDPSFGQYGKTGGSTLERRGVDGWHSTATVTAIRWQKPFPAQAGEWMNLL
jgi:hypothetical protein